MKIAVYTRVSTDMQSTDNQRATLKTFCFARGWTDVEYYDDRGVSGTTDKRPELQRLLNDAKKRKVDVIVVHKLDRLFRSLKHLIETLDEWSHLGIKFVSYSENIDMTGPAGRMMVQIIGAIAEFEAELIRSRVKGGVQAYIKKHGKWGKSPLPEWKIQVIHDSLEKKIPYGVIAKELGISKAVISKYKKILMGA